MKRLTAFGAERAGSCILGLLAIAAPTAAQQPAIEAIADARLETIVPAVDDADLLVQRLLEAAIAHARSPASELLVARAGWLSDEIDDPKALADGLARYLATPEVHGLGAETARLQLDQVLRIYDGSTAQQDAYAGYARQLLVVGPFGDSGDYYDGTPFAPELRFPELGERVAGRFGSVEPRPVIRKEFERSIELAPRGPQADGCWYALHQIRVASPLACYVEITTRSSFELFVDGAGRLAVDRSRERLPFRLHVPVSLAAGLHHVLVKTTLQSRHAIALRCVDATGRNVDGISEAGVERLLQPEPQSSADLPPLPPPFLDGLAVLLRAAEAEGASEVVRLAAAHEAFYHGASDRGNELLFAFSQAPPTEARLLLGLSELWRAASDVPTEIRDGEARRLLDAAAEGLPAEHHHLRLKQVDVLRGDDRLEDAIRRLQSAVADGSAGRATRARLADLLDDLGDEAGAELTLRKALEAHPLHVAPRLELSEQRAERGDPAGALASIEDGLRLMPGHRSLLDRARSLATDLGDADRALAAVDALWQRDAASIGAVYMRAQTLGELGDAQAAAAAWQRVAAHAEAEGDDAYRAGLALLHLGDDAAARPLLERAAAERPEHHELRRLLARLVEGEPAEEFPRIERFRMSNAEVAALLRDFEATERERAAPSTLLLDTMIVEFLPDGSYQREIHQLRRINDLRGVEAHEEAVSAASADEVVVLRTIGSDGRSYVPKRVEGAFAMPRLAPGAFVEELWRDFVSAPDEEPWRGPSFYFRGEDEAFLHSELVLLLPPGHQGKVRARSFPTEPERIELDDGYVALRYVLRDVPRLRPERFTPPLDELVPVVVYGEDRSTGGLLRMLRARAGAYGRITPPIEAATEAVIDGVDGDLARAEAIHRWVHDTIAVERGGGDPTATLMRRQGSRYFLEVAMLRAAGVPLRDAGVMDENEAAAGAAPPLFAGEVSLTTPGALVEPADGPALWLFADTPRHAPLGFISASRARAAALMVDSGELIRLPAATETAPGWDIRGRIELTAEGDALMTVEMALRDAPGYAVAQQVRDLDTNRRKLAGGGLGAQLFPGWTVVDSELHVPASGDRFRAQLELRRRGALHPAGERWQLPLPLPASSMSQRYGDAGPRELPLRLSGSTLESWVIDVDPGEHYRLAALPSDMRVASPMLDYALSFSREDQQVSIRRTVAVRPGTLPAGRFDEWMQRLGGIDAAEEARLEFVAR